jgi:hypothetical protein
MVLHGPLIKKIHRQLDDVSRSIVVFNRLVLTKANVNNEMERTIICAIVDMASLDEIVKYNPVIEPINAMLVYVSMEDLVFIITMVKWNVDVYQAIWVDSVKLLLDLAIRIHVHIPIPSV